MHPSEADADDLDKAAERKTVQLSKPGIFQASKDQWFMILASYPNLSGADYAVSLVIAKHLNSKSGLAWPSIELIAKMTNRESSTVWRSVEKLEKLGLLNVCRGRGRNCVNKYSPRLGQMNCDPKTLRRRQKNIANWKKKHCEPE
jgi:hypothetical protein